MNNKTKGFLSRISIIAIIMLIIVLLTRFILPQFYVTANFATVIVFYLLTIGIFFLTLSSFKKSIKTAFVNIFMAGTIAKLFVLLIYIIAYLFIFGDKKAIFLVFVMINYIPFTFFEIFYILKSSKSTNQSSNS